MLYNSFDPSKKRTQINHETMHNIPPTKKKSEEKQLYGYFKRQTKKSDEEMAKTRQMKKKP